MAYFAHPLAVVESKMIGENTRIWAYTHILPGAVIGENCNLCDYTFVENDVVIGNDVTVKSGVYLWDGIRLFDRVFIGPNVTFTNDLRPRSRQHPEQFVQTIVEEGASIGANSTIIAGHTIGRYAMVGAGSVVTKDIPNNTLWYGSPATFRGYICDCGQKLGDDRICPQCQKSFCMKDGNVIDR